MGSNIIKNEEIKKMPVATQLGLLSLGNEHSYFSYPSTGFLIPSSNLKAKQSSDSILEEARVKAEKMIEEAKNLLASVEQVVNQSREEGFEAGREEGLEEFNQVIVDIAQQNEEAIKGLESQGINLVYDIAEKIIGDALKTDEQALTGLIRQALQAALGQNIVVLVNPEDLEKVKKNQGSLMQSIEAFRTLQVRGDDKVAPQGCLIETEVGTIDAQLETQLKAIKKALGIE